MVAGELGVCLPALPRRRDAPSFSKDGNKMRSISLFPRATTAFSRSLISELSLDIYSPHSLTRSHSHRLSIPSDGRRDLKFHCAHKAITASPLEYRATNPLPYCASLARHARCNRLSDFGDPSTLNALMAQSASHVPHGLAPCATICSSVALNIVRGVRRILNSMGA